MSEETHAPRCPACGSDYVVEEGAGRYLCLYCHTLSQPDGQRLAANGRLCPHCAAENPGSAKTCRACGGELAPHCLKCSTPMAVWQTTCPRCGTDQAAYREVLEAQERERQRQWAEQQATRQRTYGTPRRRYRRHPMYGFWRLGWLVWPLLWLVSRAGRSLQSSMQALSAQMSQLSLPFQLPELTLPLIAGACVFSTGMVLLLTSALPAALRRN